MIHAGLDKTNKINITYQISLLNSYKQIVFNSHLKDVLFSISIL